MIDLTGKTALITGAGRGIGADTARHFHAAGAKVSLVARTASSVDALAAELGEGTLAIAADVGDWISVVAATANVIEWEEGMSLRSMVERHRSGMEFWLPIILMVLFIAALETFLAQWFSRSK